MSANRPKIADLFAAELPRKPTEGQRTVVPQTRVSTTIVSHTLVPKTTVASKVDTAKGYFPYFNDISDRLIPELKLDPFAQAVLHRLYRLSRGWKSDECTVGQGTLATQCVMSKSSVKKSLAALIEKGVIEVLGVAKKGDKEGTRYKVLPNLTVTPRTLVPNTLVRNSGVREDSTMVRETTGSRGTLVPDTNIKNINNELLKTHTQGEGSVSVGSRFAIPECRQYAESLRGQGINNPIGYAKKIYRTGEDDEFIAEFLGKGSASGQSSELKAADPECLLCHGSGLEIVPGKGARRCACRTRVVK